jgi:hypothetical protein
MRGLVYVSRVYERIFGKRSLYREKMIRDFCIFDKRVCEIYGEKLCDSSCHRRLRTPECVEGFFGA